MSANFQNNSTHRVFSGEGVLTIESLDKKSKFVMVYGPSRRWEPLQLGMHWEGHEVRFDEQGRKWSRTIDRLVMDDFGTLVEVPA